MSLLLSVPPYEKPPTAAEVQRDMDLALLLHDIDYARDGGWVLDLRPGNPSRVRVGHRRTDVVTGEFGWGYGGWYSISEHATNSEIVQAIFGLFKAYEEHETREGFLWRGRRIFGPHMDIEALHGIADQTDARPPKEEP